MVSANCTCFVVRFSSPFSASCRERISMLLSGVRSSCDMLARNSDLYLEVSDSCSAFSSISQRASSTSRFLASTSAFCRASSAALSCNSSFVCRSSSCWLFNNSSDSRSDSACFSSCSFVFLSSSCWLCNSPARDCDCSNRSSVRVLASIVFKTMPMLSVN